MNRRLHRTLKRALTKMPRLASLYRIASRYANYYEGKNGHEQVYNGELAFLRRAATQLRSSVVFDVGANVGDWTEALLNVAPQAHVHCFEPSAETFARLSARGFGSNVTLNRKGVGSQVGTLPFYYHADNDLLSSLYPIVGATGGSDASVSYVEIDTLERYCEQHGIEQIAFVKIDVEGHDLDVLKGLRTYLARRAVDVVQFEYGPSNIASRTFLRDVIEYVEPFGYDMYRILANGLLRINGYNPELEDFKLCNYVLVHPDLRDSLS